MNLNVTCPSCGSADFDLTRYRAMMVLGPDIAMFTVDCSKCAARVNVLRPIPASLREEVRASAQQVGAGGVN